MHERFSRRIYCLAVRELRSPAAAEDVCNETLVRVMEALRAGRLDSPDALPGFVAGTARNIIHEFRRKGQRVQALPDFDVAGPESTPDPLLRRTMDLILKRLKPRERDLLRLYYYEDLSKEEIAGKLGIEPERVRLVKSRALKSFRDIYDRLAKIRK